MDDRTASSAGGIISPSTVLIFAVMAAFAFSTLSTSAGAQVVWRPWRPATATECSYAECTYTPPIPITCTRAEAYCQRRNTESVTTFPEDPVFEDGPYIFCAWCAPCCIPNPCLCGSPGIVCCGTSTATKTETWSKIIDACVKAGSTANETPTQIEGEFKAEAGYTGATVSITCELWIEICTDYADLWARVTYYDNVTVVKQHQWRNAWVFAPSGCAEPIPEDNCPYTGTSMGFADIIVPGSGQCVTDRWRCAPYCE